MIKTSSKKTWLLILMSLILLIIAVGGITRMTRSGLSIVEWRPISGIIPPLNEDAWVQQFELYKATPEFQKVNSDFLLSDYKQIFIWEYLHRVLGRIIFLFALVGGLILWVRKKIELKPVLVLSFLIAIQGLVGWLMVVSGLQSEPRVSPYMLALHFSLAIITLTTAYYYLSETRARLEYKKSPQKTYLLITVGILLFAQVIYGCLTSGLRAGSVSSTFPLMHGRFYPEMTMALEPSWTNFFENPILVQWIHRWLGIITLLCVYLLGWQFIKTESKKIRGPFIHLMGITSSQIILGILNIVFKTPIWLAVTHQLIAALIVLGYFNLIFRLKNRSI